MGDIADPDEDAHVSHTGARATETRLGESLRAIVRNLKEVRAERELRLRKTKGRFNLFTALRSAGDETRLHSRFLAYLLNPRGLHDCGPLFLHSFLGSLRQAAQATGRTSRLCALSFPTELDCSEAIVKPEVAFDNGRIDILMRFPKWGAIAIENKVWAGEQFKQIERYATYLAETNPQFLVIYLTLDGRETSTAGQFGDKCFNFSYKDDIHAWLDDCLKATCSFMNIHHALQQYADVIRDITGINREDQLTEITKIMAEYPEIIEHSGEIQKAVTMLREEQRAKFWDETRHAMKDSGIIIEKMVPTHGWFCAVVQFVGSELGHDKLDLRVYHTPNAHSYPLYVCVADWSARNDSRIGAFLAEMRKDSQYVQPENENRIAVELTDPVSDANLALQIRDQSGQALMTSAHETAKRITEFVKIAEEAWKKFKQKYAG